MLTSDVIRPLMRSQIRSVIYGPTISVDLDLSAFGRGSAVTFESGGDPVLVAERGSVRGSGIASMTITPTGIVDTGDETLTIAAQSIDPETPVETVAAPWTITVGESAIVITHSGAPTASDWQALLRAIEYDNAAESPTAGDRSLSFVVSDGTRTSAAAVVTVTVEDSSLNNFLTSDGETFVTSDGETFKVQPE